MIDIIKKEINDSIEVKNKLISDHNLIKLIKFLFDKCLYSLKNNGKIIFCGNGGSFADSQHLAAEFISRLRVDRSPLPSIALGTNSSNLTALSNDYGYENIFSREIEVLGSTDDIFIPISTSGNSLNILKAIETAKNKGIYVFGFSGKDGGIMKNICDQCFIVPSTTTDKIQESHIMVGHLLCHLIETNIFKK